MLPRTLEPEVMDSLEEAVDYDSMDHSEVNRSFADEFLAALGKRGLPQVGTSLEVLDVGTGTARIPIEICQRSRDIRITAADLAGHMLQLAQRNVIEAGLSAQIKLDQVDAKGLPYPKAHFDAVISNSIVHHIPEPLNVLREMTRVLRPGGLLFVRDLMRLPSDEKITAILAKYAAGTNDHHRELFERSLHAALTVAETGERLRTLGYPADWVAPSSDRHWTICGWLPDS
jgi:ubiquinone/menaquinone biosynthesis C-methylase UbiE